MSGIRVTAEVPLQADLMGEPSPGILSIESDGLYTDRIRLRLPNGRTMLLVSASALRRAIDAASMGNA